MTVKDVLALEVVKTASPVKKIVGIIYVEDV